MKGTYISNVPRCYIYEQYNKILVLCGHEEQKRLQSQIGPSITGICIINHLKSVSSITKTSNLFKFAYNTLLQPHYNRFLTSVTKWWSWHHPFGQLPYQICEGMSAIAAPLAAMACLYSVFLTIIYIPSSAVNNKQSVVHSILQNNNSLFRFRYAITAISQHLD